MENCSLFTKQCIKNYSTNWQVVHFRYAQYSGGYADLPNLPTSSNLNEELYEIDIDEDSGDIKSGSDNITQEGWLMKGPEIGRVYLLLNPLAKADKLCLKDLKGDL